MIVGRIPRLKRTHTIIIAALVLCVFGLVVRCWEGEHSLQRCYEGARNGYYPGGFYKVVESDREDMGTKIEFRVIAFEDSGEHPENGLCATWQYVTYPGSKDDQAMMAGYLRRSSFPNMYEVTDVDGKVVGSFQVVYKDGAERGVAYLKYQDASMVLEEI